MGKFILNGKIYTGNSADGFPPLIYSDDEREVGVWRDGRPLYQKTIPTGNLPNNSSINLPTPSNIKDVINYHGFIKYRSDTIIQRPIPFVGSGNNDIRVDLNNGTLRIVTYTNWSDYDGYLVIQYTKTTDTPSSGRWATRSVVYHAAWTATSVPGGSGYPLTDGITLPPGQYLIILKSPYSTSGSSTQFIMALDLNGTPAYNYGVCNPNTPSYAQFVTIITLTETTVVRGLTVGGYAVSWDSNYLTRGGIDAIRL